MSRNPAVSIKPMPSALALLDEDQLSTYLGVPVRTLQKWRLDTGTVDGPPYIKIGAHVRYRVESVDVWLLEREVGRSA